MADEITTATAVETERDFGTDDTGATVRRWVAELGSYHRAFGTWESDVEKIVKRYREERPLDTTQVEPNKAGSKRFGVLWSSVQTAAPLLYSKPPDTAFERRFKDPDPVGRTAVEVLERCTQSNQDRIDFDGALRAARLDYQLAARGQVWIRYVPIHGEPEDVLDGKEGETFEPVVDEKVEVDFVHWKDFRHGVAPSWGLVPWVARRVTMTRSELVSRFGREIGEEVPLDKRVAGVDRETAAHFGDVFKRAEVWEIWDRQRREVIWICTSYTKRWLDRRMDPLHLREFFPCPKPLYGTLTNESLVPVPDYKELRSQAEELDNLTRRLGLVTEAIKAMGVYDGSIDELVDLLNPRVENKMIAVESWIRLQEGGGLKGAVDFLPIEMFVTVAQALVTIRNEVKQDYYEVSGLADVVRGASDPTETATAQDIKARFAGARLEDRQREVQRFVRDIIELIAEIIAEHFELETLAELSNFPFSINADPQTFAAAVELLKNDRLRTFRIDIETDSTVMPDRKDERAKRIEFMEVVTPFLEKATEAIAKAPQMGKLVSELLMFVIRGFATGRQLESVFEEALDQIGTIQAPPDPSIAEAQGKNQIEMFKAQKHYEIELGKLEMERGKLDIEMAKLEIERLKAINEGTLAGRELAMKIAGQQAELRLKARDLDIKSEDLVATRDRDSASQSLAMSQFEDSRVARTEEREMAEMTDGSHEEMADTVNAIGDLGDAMAKIVDQLAQSIASSQAAQTRALVQFQQLTADLVEAATAPREVVRENGQITGSRVVSMVPGPETVQ